MWRNVTFHGNKTMNAQDLQEDFNLSPAQIEKLKTYHALLLKWQRAINLVSPKTIEDAWVRHFYDSAQLLEHIPETTKIVADLGSGGGFPGLVLAILRPDLEVHLIESDQRKCEFLKTVSRETDTSCTVHNARIETIVDSITPDLVTARALAPVRDLLDYASIWSDKNPQLQFLLLKGEKAQAECDDAHKHFEFDITLTPSKTQKDAHIVQLKNVRKLDA